MSQREQQTARVNVDDATWQAFRIRAIRANRCLDSGPHGSSAEGVRGSAVRGGSGQPSAQRRRSGIDAGDCC
jgi:hypothetical protein